MYYFILGLRKWIDPQFTNGLSYFCSLESYQRTKTLPLQLIHAKTCLSSLDLTMEV